MEGIYAYSLGKEKGLRHPRKDNSSTSSLAWRRRKLSGGHCECFEKQAFGFIIIDIDVKNEHTKETKKFHHIYAQKKKKQGFEQNKQAIKPGNEGGFKRPTQQQAFGIFIINNSFEIHKKNTRSSKLSITESNIKSQKKYIINK